jgi:hypothetical protein
MMRALRRTPPSADNLVGRRRGARHSRHGLIEAFVGVTVPLPVAARQLDGTRAAYCFVSALSDLPVYAALRTTLWRKCRWRISLLSRQCLKSFTVWRQETYVQKMS